MRRQKDHQNSSGKFSFEKSYTDTIARHHLLSRRSVLRALGLSAVALAGVQAQADELVKLPLPSDPRQRPMTRGFPQKGSMILQRTRPPLLETPMEVFDRGVFTPNEEFYVRWRWVVIPNSVDANTFRLAVRGHVNQELQLSISDILAMPRVELAAVNQCSGNSRGFFLPRVAGAQWAHGAMGNARWTGVRWTYSIAPASGLARCRFDSMAWTNRLCRMPPTSRR
jgi:DMSO/TMAO reductase YedYZ molybdopterin-dependent catalytic subunit